MIDATGSRTTGDIPSRGEDLIEAVGYSQIPKRPAVELEIVMPVYNQEDALPGALDTISRCLASQHFSAAIVVVDMGSSDRSIDIAARWPAGAVAVHLLGCAQREEAVAALEAMTTSQARFVAICDVRTAVLINNLDHAMPLLYNGVQVVSCSRRLCEAVMPYPATNQARRWIQAIPARRLPGRMARLLSHAEPERGIGFGFFHLQAAFPLVSACIAGGMSLDFDMVAVAHDAGIRGVEL